MFLFPNNFRIYHFAFASNNAAGLKIVKDTWLGVTVDVKKSKERIDYLRNLNATIKFLSCEPLLEDLGVVNLQGIKYINPCLCLSVHAAEIDQKRQKNSVYIFVNA